jgi:iron complex outermembrane receptor protein
MTAPTIGKMNVTNLTDKEYFSNCWSWEACSYGPARNIMRTTSYRS